MSGAMNPESGMAAPPAERLPVWLKITHGFGSIAYGVKENGFATFLLLFYNQVIGLDAGLVGTAIMLALIADAFVDPVIGELSDRTQTRWGRRLPWLYGAPIPLAVAWMLLWNPPEMSNAMTVAWLVGFAIVVRTLVSMCEVPSVALVPELTGDYDERTAVMRYRFLFGWAGGLVIMIMAYAVFFRANGETDPAGYVTYSAVGAIAMAAAVLFSAAGQHRRIARPSPPQPRQATGIAHVLAEMRQTLSNRAFLWLIFAALFGFVNQGIAYSMTNYLIGFVWMLEQVEKAIYAFMLFFSMIAAFIIVTPLSRKLGKRDATILSGAISLAFNTLLYGLYLTDLFPGMPDKPNVALMFAIVLASNTFAISVSVLSSSMMADVVEASQAETERRSEGLFFAGYFFMQKCATGLGIFAAGIILSLASFPIGAQPGGIDLETRHDLALGYVVALLLIGSAGLLVMRRFPISRQDHQARLARIAADQGTGGAGVP
ncbi:MAG: MFS transporter [Alphaproteobacteria bacterium]|nr:MAG: MFS transporter [Alphaproteobacteria bacterium]